MRAIPHKIHDATKKGWLAEIWWRGTKRDDMRPDGRGDIAGQCMRCTMTSLHMLVAIEWERRESKQGIAADDAMTAKSGSASGC